MNRTPLQAEERTILGKKVKGLRKAGFVPGHVFGKNRETEHVSVKYDDFMKAFAITGESGLIDLKIGTEKIRPVLVRDVQVDVMRGDPLHIDFYQVNLTETVRVTVPVELIGEQPELVHSGEAVIIQPMNEVEVEALPAELPEKLEVDITSLKQIGDVFLVSQLTLPTGVILTADPEAVVAKLDSAVTAEMQKLLEEQAAEQAAVTEAAATEAPAEGAEAPTEAGEEGATEEKPTAPTEEKKEVPE